MKPSLHWLGMLGITTATVGMIGLATSDTGPTTTPPISFTTAVATASVESSAPGQPQELGASASTPLAITAPASAATALEPAETHNLVALIPPPPAPVQGTIPHTTSDALAEQAHEASAKPTAERIKTTQVRRGDNMAVLFRRLELPKEDLHRLLAHKSAAKTLGKIHPGQTIEARLSPQGRLSALRYDMGAFEFFTVTFDADALHTKRTIERPETRVAFAEGAIETNFFESAAATGLSDKQIMELADLFAWDVDFARDIRQGDRFALLYESLHRGDEQVGTGRILAAEFVNNGDTHRTVYFEHEDRGGYYDPEGHPIRKTFLRSPVNFTRISSGFSLKRWHPKLHRFRAHKGVDYAAPIGTPIQAAGDGKIKFAGKKGGYGRVVIIQHGQRYSTLYAHLHRIKGGIKPGARVKQGQTIGTVGRSGLVTGPHLHYEFRVDGAHRNPLKVKLPGAPGLPEKLMTQFTHQTSGYMTQLAKLTATNLAARD